MRNLATAIALSTLQGFTTDAQTFVSAGSGIEFRYHDDTIWMMGDSTATRTIYRSDTTIRSSCANDKLIRTATWLLMGDAAQMLDSRDASGHPLSRNVYVEENSLYSILHGTRSIEVASQQNAMNASRIRMPAGSGLPSSPSNDAPENPADTRRYAVSANMNLVQHATLFDTSVAVRLPVRPIPLYRILGADSLKRVSPSPLMFGPLTVTAVRADMGNAMTMRNVRSDGLNYDGISQPTK